MEAFVFFIHKGWQPSDSLDSKPLLQRGWDRYEKIIPKRDVYLSYPNKYHSNIQYRLISATRWQRKLLFQIRLISKNFATNKRDLCNRYKLILIKLIPEVSINIKKTSHNNPDPTVLITVRRLTPGAFIGLVNLQSH